MITLLLAWQLAKRYGKSESAAIKRCARKILAETKDSVLYNNLKAVVSTSSDVKVVDFCQRAFDGYKELGVLK